MLRHSEVRELKPAKSPKSARGAVPLQGAGGRSGKVVEASARCHVARNAQIRSGEVAGVRIRCCEARKRKGCCVQRRRWSQHPVLRRSQPEGLLCPKKSLSPYAMLRRSQVKGLCPTKSLESPQGDAAFASRALPDEVTGVATRYCVACGVGARGPAKSRE